MVAQAATVAQVTSGEVAPVAGTRSHSLLYARAAGEGRVAVRVGKEVPCPRSHNSCSAGWDQSASRAGQCWAALLGVVYRSGRPGNRQCLGTEGGEHYLKGLGRSGLGTVPSTPPLSSSTDTGQGLGPQGSFSPVTTSFPGGPRVLTNTRCSPPAGLGYYLTSHAVCTSLQTACKPPKGRSFQYTQHV